VFRGAFHPNAKYGISAWATLVTSQKADFSIPANKAFDL